VKTLGRFFAILLLGLSLQYIGAKLNHIAVTANGGKMPVLVLNEKLLVDIMADDDHKPMDKNTRYPVLCDYILVPFIYDFELHKDMMSVGDVLLFTGSMTMVSLYLFPLFVLARKIKRAF
jgi:hypothetical protein